jgi:16S rRNA (cytosine1402-N4)-methyltransferase
MINHEPVLLEEVISYLNPSSNENFIDCTVGFGGHSLKILEKIKPNGKILGIDADLKDIEHFKSIIKDHHLKDNLTLVNGNFKNLKEIVEDNNFFPINGILFDLGLSSWQIEQSGKGFSFLRDEPLDMRFGKGEITAAEIINQWPEEKLAEIFQEYGQERFSRKIARKIVQERKQGRIQNTQQLADLIKRSVRRSKIHPATRVFQSLRIAVNDELASLEKAIPQAIEILEPQGRLVIISFHSLEDRIVKNLFRQKAKDNLIKILTKKPISPNLEEIEMNRRSRSSKLRAIQKI